MNHLRLWPAILGVFLAAVFLSSCGGSQTPTTKSEVPRITVQELKERMDSGEAVVIGDTRGEAEYNVRHVAGAVSIPLQQVEAHLEGLPRDQEIILYCT
jgi:predicted sulfurtransferase